MSRSLTQEQQERVWQLWAEGRSPRAIGREVGFWAQGVRNFVGHTGGVRPPERRRSEHCLSKAEREEISRGLARGEGFRAIGRAISRDHTTVSREVNRNGGLKSYRAQAADEAAWGRARRPKPSKLYLNPKLRAVVEEKLCLKWSPQQISRWLRRTYPDHEAMQVSHETIYLSLFVQGRGALRRELTSCLRSGRHTRHPRAQRPKRQGQGKIPGRVMISERPAEVEDRAVPGHWEGDLLLGRKPTGIATLVERSTRYCQLVALARRPKRGSCSRRTHKVDRAAARAASPLSYLGSGPRDEGPPQLHSRKRCSGLLLRSPEPLAAGLKREHKRATSPVLPQALGPRCGLPSRARPRRGGA